MKRLILIVMATFILAGCGPSALQIQAEIAYYEAVATIQKNQAAQPVFKMVATDATKPIVIENVATIEVYQQRLDTQPIAQYQQKDYSAPAWQFLGTLVSVATPWIGVGVLAHEFRNMATGTAYNYNNNVSQGATGNFRVQGNTTSTSSGAGASSATGMTDATSTPTVVHADVVPVEPVIVPAPEPIIVK
jgi:hypothetical protein